MYGQRPLRLTLRTGHVLTTTADSEHWTVKPTLSRLTDKPMILRDLIERIAHEDGTDAAYGLDARNGTIFVTYAILADLRKAHGGSFAWTVVQPDHSATLILDELDDLCCESRAWTRGASVAQLQDLARAHHARIGFLESPVTTPAIGSLRVEQDGETLFLRGRSLTMEFSTPRGPTPQDVGFATYLASLSLESGYASVAR